MEEPEVHIFTLKSIIFLDSLCFGLMYSHIAPHLIDISGTQLGIGIFNAFNILLSLVSKDITRSFLSIKGKKFATYMIFMISIMSHLFVSMTYSVTFTIFSRLLFTAVNEANRFCKDLFFKIAPDSTHEQEKMILDILSSLGYIIGPSIGGYIFTVPGGFTILALLTAGITFANVLLLLRIPVMNEDNKPQAFDEQEVIERYKTVIDKNIEDVKNSNWKVTWPFLAVQILVTCGWTMFFSKFTQVMHSNFNSGSSTFGNAASYKNLLLFGSVTLSTDLKSKYLNDVPLVSTLDCSLIINFCAICGMCYSQSFLAYWVLCIPLVFTKSLINSYWPDMHSQSENSALVNLIPAINIASGIIMPIFFGIVCTHLCPNLVKFVSVSLVLAAFLIFTFIVKPNLK
ncbi:unnamed protein product [Brassicogethes aeneus]|uniref:Uncharacterized protein n=1 Tax=Brassicogethes aeneus TaxID=1431903 RepID=A0A9P0FL30_BRAAE|nr:unnamed protein product [Brassicogethes aeneus]